jgi:hypothetical protein
MPILRYTHHGGSLCARCWNCPRRVTVRLQPPLDARNIDIGALSERRRERDPGVDVLDVLLECGGDGVLRCADEGTVGGSVRVFGEGGGEEPVGVGNG